MGLAPKLQIFGHEDMRTGYLVLNLIIGLNIIVNRGNMPQTMYYYDLIHLKCKELIPEDNHHTGPAMDSVVGSAMVSMCQNPSRIDIFIRSD